MKRQTLIVLSAAAIVYLIAPATASAVDYLWSDNGDGTCTITDYTGPGGAVTLPGTLGGLTVTSIGDDAFSGCSSLTRIAMPDGVTSIGRFAFSDCINLTSVAMPDGVTSIGRSAFSNCSSLTSIEIPDSVTSIRRYTFSGCTGMTGVTIGNSITSLGNWAFYDCTSLTGVYFKGNPPTLEGTSVFSGNDDTIIYYLPINASNWPATFGGRPTAVWPLSLADFDFDGEVNYTDFALFAGQWLKADCQASNSWCQGTDFNFSGSVDTLDLVEFAAEWSYGACIAEHVFEIEMSLSYDYGEGYGSSVPWEYEFDAWMWVDDTVVSGTLRTPGGVVYPAEMEVDDGENWLGVFAWSDALEDLSDFTDGAYIFTVTYANGTSQSTTIPFEAADGSPLTVPPCPVMTYPVHNSTNVPLRISFLLDPSNMTNPVWTYGLEYFPASGSGLEGEFENLPGTTTTVGPVNLSANTEYEIELTANHAIWSTNEDGIPYVIDKDAEVEILFTTGS